MKLNKDQMRAYQYAVKREKEHIAARKKEDKAFNKRIDSIYKNLRFDIQDEIYKFIGRYADKEGITRAEANKRIENIDYKRALKRVSDMNLRGQLTEEQKRQLDNLNITANLTRLEMLLENVNLSLIDTYGRLETNIGDYLIYTGKKELETQAEDLNLTIHSSQKIKNSVEKIAKADFHTATFSERLWADKANLKNNLELGITKTIIRGQNPKRWSRNLQRNLKDNIANAEYSARRIAITETARVQGEVVKESFKSNGYDKYIYIAEPTACEICTELDGTVHKIEDAVPGINYYPMHPFCKCGASPYYEEN